MLLFKVTGILGVVSVVVLINHVHTYEQSPSSSVYSLEDQPSKTTTYDEQELGGHAENKRKLVADTYKNKRWWDEAYQKRILQKQRTNMPSSSFFWRVSRGYGYDSMSLNKICSIAYKMKISEIEKYRDWIKSDLESYCTISGHSGSLKFSDPIKE